MKNWNEIVIANIKKIRTSKNIKQTAVAFELDMDGGNYSKIERGQQHLKVIHLGIIASALKCDVIDLFTYPKVYVDSDTTTTTKERISVTFEVSPDKRDVLLNLVTKSE